MINTCISEYVYDLRGLSTDEKPTKNSFIQAGIGHAPANGSTFVEIDTADAFLYDESNDLWIKVE